MSNKYGINDLDQLDNTPMEYDGEALPTAPTFGPPPDGNYHLVLRPNPKGDDDFIQIRTSSRGQFVMARVKIRIFDEDRQRETAFLGTGVLNSIKWDNQPTNDLAALCKIAGQPMPNGLTALEFAQHLDKVLTDNAEEGIHFTGRAVWEMSFQTVDENGMPVYKDDGRADYTTIRGERKIKALVSERAQAEAAQKGLTGPAQERFITDALESAHLYTDPVSGNEREVRLVLTQIIGPVK